MKNNNSKQKAYLWFLFVFLCLPSLASKIPFEEENRRPQIHFVSAPTPESTFNPTEGMIENLKAQTLYRLYFNSTSYKDYTSDEEGRISVLTNQDLLGKVIEGILIPADMVENDEDSLEQYCNYQIPGAIEAMPTASFVSKTGMLSNLVKDASYRLSFYEGSSYELLSVSNEEYNLSTNSKTVGKTLTSLVKIGDGSSTISSFPQSFNDKILPPGQIVSSFSPEGGYIYGLYGNASYQLITTESETINKSSDASGTLYADQDLYGKTIDKLYLLSDGTTYTDAGPQVNLNYLFLGGRENPPSASYEEEKDLLTGLETSKTYILYFDDSSSFEFQAVEQGSFSLAEIESLKNKVIVSIKIKGDHILKSDSLPQFISGTILPKMAAPSPVFDTINGQMTALEKNVTYLLKDDSGASYEIQADNEGTIKISEHTILLGKKLISIQALKTTGYIDSDLKTISFKIASKLEEEPSAVYSQESGLLTGLVKDAPYTLLFSDGTEEDIIANTNGAYCLTDTFAFLGKRLSGLKKKGDGVNSISSKIQSFASPLIAIRYSIPSAKYENGFISGLAANGLYEFTFADLSSIQIKADSQGYIFPWKEDGLSGQTILSLVQKGDNLKYLTSAAQTNIEWLIPSIKEKTPEANFKKDDGTLNGLIQDASYLLICEDGTVLCFKANGSSVDLASLPELIGKTISGLVKVGDGKSTADSAMEILKSAILPHEPLPEASYQAPYLINLKPSANYTLVFSDGTTINFKANTQGTINTIDNEAFYNETLVGIIKKGNDVSTIDSLTQTVSYVLPRRVLSPDAQKLSFDYSTGILSGLEEASSYILTFSDQTLTTIKTRSGETQINLTGYAQRTIISIAKAGDGINSVTSLPTALMIKIPVISAEPTNTNSITLTLIFLSCLLALSLIYIALFFIWKKTGIKLPKFLVLSFRGISRTFEKKNKSEN